MLRLLAEGGHVVAADVSEAGLKDTAEKAGATIGRLTTLLVDIADEDSVREGVAAAVSALGGLDVLVNAAGILRSSHTHETSLADLNKVVTVNLTGTFLMTREAIPALLEGDGAAVVNFSSTSAMFAHPYMAAYAATRAASSRSRTRSPRSTEAGFLRAVAVASRRASRVASPTDTHTPGYVERKPRIPTGRCSPRCRRHRQRNG